MPKKSTSLDKKIKVKSSVRDSVSKKTLTTKTKVIKKPSKKSLVDRPKVVAKKLAPKKRAPVTKKIRSKKPASRKKEKPVKENKLPTDNGHVKKSKLEPVVLPTNMSLRSIEKTVVLKHEFDYLFRDSAYKIAYFSGLCLMLVGVSYMSPAYLTNFQTHSTQAANAIVSYDAPRETFVQVTTEIPKIITKDYPVSFTANDASLVMVTLVPDGRSNFFKVETKAVSKNNYQFTIPIDTVPPGYYSAFIYVKSEGDKAKTFETRHFHIGETEPALDVKYSNEKNPTQLNDSDGLTTVPPDVSPKEFSVFTNNHSLRDTAIVGISAPEDYPYIELYIRPLQSLNSRFLTVATKRYSQWQFVFDTTNIPNGKYELFAQTKKDGKLLQSKPVLVDVANIQTPTEVSEPRRPIVTTEPVATDPRDLIKINDQDFELSDEERKGINQETDAILMENSSSINDLLKNYAAAAQSNDKLLVETAKKALQEKKDEIVSNTLRDERTQGISDDIDKDLQNKIAIMQSRVEVFEALRRDKSSGDTAIDSDGDGISDVDEVLIYKTNPNLSDTDNDGVTDGIEIMRGYDPNDSKAEAIIQFESPKDNKILEYTDVITVSEVKPIINVGVPEEEKQPIKTEIRGKSLPDSFITLYIFSAPTVVTIKTDADGSFVYVFDKELEDGRHDVYAAITDNAGEIIAQSSPFSFVKTAEAFSPVDAEASSVITTGDITEPPKDTYNVVAGIGILSLGLILLMLGISLRSKKEDEVIITENDITNSDSKDKHSTTD